MTKLSGISQVKYIVNKDTCVCYTLEENRNIALEFINGDKYNELYTNCTRENEMLRVINSILTSRDDSSKIIITKFKISYDKCYNTAIKEESKNIKLRNKFNISLGIIGTLILIIIL